MKCCFYLVLIFNLNFLDSSIAKRGQLMPGCLLEIYNSIFQGLWHRWTFILNSIHYPANLVSLTDVIVTRLHHHDQENKNTSEHDTWYWSQIHIKAGLQKLFSNKSVLFVESPCSLSNGRMGRRIKTMCERKAIS